MQKWLKVSTECGEERERNPQKNTSTEELKMEYNAYDASAERMY